MAIKEQDPNKSSALDTIRTLSKLGEICTEHFDMMQNAANFEDVEKACVELRLNLTSVIKESAYDRIKQYVEECGGSIKPPHENWIITLDLPYGKMKFPLDNLYAILKEAKSKWTGKVSSDYLSKAGVVAKWDRQTLAFYEGVHGKSIDKEMEAAQENMETARRQCLPALVQVWKKEYDRLEKIQLKYTGFDSYKNEVVMWQRTAEIAKCIGLEPYGVRKAIDLCLEWTGGNYVAAMSDEMIKECYEAMANLTETAEAVATAERELIFFNAEEGYRLSSSSVRLYGEVSLAEKVRLTKKQEALNKVINAARGKRTAAHNRIDRIQKFIVTLTEEGKN